MKKLLFLIVASLCLFACEKGPEEIPVTSFSLSQPTADLLVGESLQLKAIILPSNATDQSVVWATSAPSVATIGDNGLLSAVGIGICTITASCGEKKDRCVVTVKSPIVEVSSVELDKTEITLTEEEVALLSATVKPDDATDKTVAWQSSDEGIASVADGKVKAIKPGMAIISASAGHQSAHCKVLVVAKIIPVESITLDKDVLTLQEGELSVLTATVKPDDATDKTVQWSCSDEGIASVENGIVKALKPGTAIVTATAGQHSAECKVQVSAKAIPVESITLDKSILTMQEEESKLLTATVKPDNATDKTVQWSSSDTQVVTVDEGRVTSVKEGKATITAKAGNKTATCEVTVKKKVVEVASVTLDRQELQLKKGEEATLTATVSPEDATDSSVSWSSSAGDVASVDQQGKVKALKSGTAVITATAGEMSATCEVTVTTPVESVSLDRNHVTLYKDETVTLHASVSPSDADTQTVLWSSSNSAVATVSEGFVQAVNAGSATITATAGEKSASCVVTVEWVDLEGLYANAAPELKNGDHVLASNPYVEQFLTEVNYPDKNLTFTKILDYYGGFDGVNLTWDNWASDWPDGDKPNSYSIRWIPKDGEGAYTLTLSDSRGWKVSSSIPSGKAYADITNLVPNDSYHYKVSTVSGSVKVQGNFTTYGNIHQVFFKTKCRNARDLGGWQTENGKTVKYRKVYRGGRMNDRWDTMLSNAGKQEVLDEGIGAELELRGSDDYLTTPAVAGLDHCHPCIEEGGKNMLGVSKPSAKNCAKWLKYDQGRTDITDVKSYQPTAEEYIAFQDAYKAKTKECFEFVYNSVRAGKGVYFHCSLGRDRTGTMAVLILGVLGVREGDISKEYELTYFAPVGFSVSSSDKASNPIPVYYNDRTHWVYSDIVPYFWSLSTDGTFRSGVENYLVNVAHVSQQDVNDFRSLMLE